MAQALTLQQAALGAGFDSLSDLATAAKVSSRTVYHANIGIAPSPEVSWKIIKAIARRDQRFGLAEFLAALREGQDRGVRKLKEALT